MIKIILHFGIAKTATTSIQNILSNSDNLKSGDVYLGRHYKDDIVQRNVLDELCRFIALGDVDKSVGLVYQIIEETERKGYKRAIISHENLLRQTDTSCKTLVHVLHASTKIRLLQPYTQGEAQHFSQVEHASSNVET